MSKSAKLKAEEVSSLQELERLKDEREKVLDEIERINLNSDFTFVNIEVKKKWPDKKLKKRQFIKLATPFI